MRRPRLPWHHLTMLSSLLSSLTSLRDFFSRAFFIAAFIPALLFVFINATVFYVWNWPAHDWIDANLLQPKGVNQAIVFAGLFFFIWINAYLVSSLTPLWTRSLEGSNWWPWVRDLGTKPHLKRFLKLNAQIDQAVTTYANIELNRPQRRLDVEDAIAISLQEGPKIKPPTRTVDVWVKMLQVKRRKNELITNEEIDNMIKAQIDMIKINGNTVPLQVLAGTIEDLVDYSISRARAQHILAMNERNMDFPEQADIAPTRFGNIGQTAQTNAMRAYGFNLTNFWSALRHVAQKDESSAKNLENTKSQLDFLVAGFWLSLTLAVEWSVIFAMDGNWKATLTSAIAGPAICWFWWYGAAVEQYRALQDLIGSCVTSFRIQVLTELHFGAPISIEAERYLWRVVDKTLAMGEPNDLDFQFPKVQP
jgi:hypothetical protein